MVGGQEMDVYFLEQTEPSRVYNKKKKKKKKKIDELLFADLPQCFRRERCLALEGVEHNAFKQIAERHILIIGQRLQHLKESSFHAHSRLHTLDLDLLGRFWHGCFTESMVPVYIGTRLRSTIMEMRQRRRQ